MAQASAEETLNLEQLFELGQQLRVDSVRAAAAAGSGHPTSSMSAADLMTVLFARHLRYDFSAPENRANDHLVFSKGHASPLLYSLYKMAGAIDDEELLTFREFGSRLQGHPTPEIPWVDVATETGMLHPLRELRPDVDFVAANEAASCRFMKMITLPKLRDALRDLKYEVKVPEDIAQRARIPIERMVAIG